MLELGTVLPKEPPSGIRLVAPRNAAEELREIKWFPAVRDTEPLARYGRVFDYKWLSWKDGELRGHAFALLFWDGLLATMLFHAPVCECGLCEDWKLGRPVKGDGAAGTNGGDNADDASADAKPQSA